MQQIESNTVNINILKSIIMTVVTEIVDSFEWP